RGHDSQTVEIWRDKFTRYANEAVLDLANVLELRRTDTLSVNDGIADISKLPRCCIKVLSMWHGIERVPFITGPSHTLVRPLFGGDELSVVYRYLPRDMASPSDVPELPDYCHGMIVTYVVARERASADPSMQRGADIYLALYTAAKRKLSPSLGEENLYKIENKW
ncbi:MAG TPA: hypothetical protein PLH38_04610, partial [Clostridia bacterium]|nr:hypothetical protein [Clostridia bacterium]